MITTLKNNEIFVFGSNLMGRHGAGAAKQAMNDFGAIYGQGVGLHGQTYAIPTKGFDLRYALPINSIKSYIDEFIEFTKTRLDLVFLVTEIGCGLAGYTHEEIAPLFKEAINLNNVVLPKSFLTVLNKKFIKSNMIPYKSCGWCDGPQWILTKDEEKHYVFYNNNPDSNYIGCEISEETLSKYLNKEISAKYIFYSATVLYVTEDILAPEGIYYYIINDLEIVKSYELREENFWEEDFNNF